MGKWALIKGAFHFSEVATEAIPVILRISPLIKTILPDQSNLKCYAWRKLCFIKNSLKKLIYFSKWPIRSWSDRPVLTFEKHLKLPAQTKKNLPSYSILPDSTFSSPESNFSQSFCSGLSGRWLFDRLLTARIQNSIFIYGLGMDYLGTLPPTLFCLWVQRNIQCICHEKDIYLNPIHWAKQPDSFSTDGIILYQMPSWLPWGLLSNNMYGRLGLEVKSCTRLNTIFDRKKAPLIYNYYDLPLKNGTPFT